MSSSTKFTIRNTSKKVKERLMYIAKEKKGVTLSRFMRDEIDLIIEQHKHLVEPSSIRYFSNFKKAFQKWLTEKTTESK